MYTHEFARDRDVCPLLVRCLAEDAGLATYRKKYLEDELEGLLAKIPHEDRLVGRADAMKAMRSHKGLSDPVIAEIVLELLKAPSFVAHGEPFFFETDVRRAADAIEDILSSARGVERAARDVLSRGDQEKLAPERFAQAQRREKAPAKARMPCRGLSIAAQVAEVRSRYEGELVDPREARAILGLSASAFGKWRAQGKLPVAVVVGKHGKLLFDAALVRSLAETLTVDLSTHCTGREAAGLLGKTIAQLNWMRSRGTLTGTLSRGNLYYKREDIRRLLRQREEASA